MKPKKVVIVDDEPIVCERLKPALERLGFQVETYTESQKAIERFAEEKFDVLVTDLKMRKPDGMDILHFVTRQSPGTKVIVITGFATVETARQALKEGAVDFIAKPFKISELTELIMNLASE